MQGACLSWVHLNCARLRRVHPSNVHAHPVFAHVVSAHDVHIHAVYVTWEAKEHQASSVFKAKMQI
jgi:hypothetical protein